MTLGCSLVVAHSAHATNTPMKNFVYWETRANAAATRSNETFVVEHFEIPLSALQHSFSDQLDPKIRNSLIFNKGGKPFVRWIINPDDTKWCFKIQDWLRSKGLDDHMYQFFSGHRTASRSIIVENHQNGVQFSVKVSTNRTGGMWQDKVMDVEDAAQVRWADHFVGEGVPMEMMPPSHLARQAPDVPQAMEMAPPSHSAREGFPEPETPPIPRDKRQDATDARQVRLANRYLGLGKPLEEERVRPHQMSALHGPIRTVSDTPFRRIHFDHFKVLDEPAEFDIGEIDQAMLIRSLGELNEGKYNYLPGFSAMHEHVGKEIAERNGSHDPATYWNEHYNKPLARALAEFSAHFGLSYDSPHSQNFLIELDLNYRPTGKIILRDFGDSYAFRGFFEALGEIDFLEQWSPENVLSNPMTAVGILHGNTAPSWLPDEKYDAWGTEFFQEYEKTFSQLTGVPERELNRAPLEKEGRYFTKTYSSGSLGYLKYLIIAECFQGKLVTSDGNPCPEHLKRKMFFPKHERCSELLKPSEKKYYYPGPTRK
ncbi:MAG: hypothetical protein H7222_04865 [Methylotenera sp.]|nr:hypothetical protein [Oligoflexia bacterium]